MNFIILFRKSLIILISIFIQFIYAKDSQVESKISSFESLELFNKVLNLVENQYYRKVDREKLIQGALKGMLATLDPHSAYLGEEIFAKMQEDTEGEFGGLGIEVSLKDGILTVVTPIEDTPAFNAGIKPGDSIVEIDHDSTRGLSLEDAAEKMRGEKGSKVIVGIMRKGWKEIKRFTLIRKIIKIKPVKFELIDDYLYVRLIQFQKRSASSIVEAIKKSKKDLKKKKLAGIVLDLRSNPGGLLDEAVKVSSIFMDRGIVVSTEGRDPRSKEIRYVKKTGYKDLNTPLAVLINGASASASEIVAGALKDSKRAIIMGSTSFGKGSVQSVAKIDNKRGVKLTIAQYMTPSNTKIQALGIEPDIFIENIDYEKIIEGKIPENYVREVDLRNHLNAYIESDKEKKERLAKEKRERIERIKQAQKIRAKKDSEKRNSDSKTKEKFKPKFEPKEDYQVLKAIDYLKSFKVFKKMR